MISKDQQKKRPESEQTEEPRQSAASDSGKTGSGEAAAPDNNATDITGRAADEVGNIEEPPTAVEQENNDLKDRLLRLSAEFDNYKKRIDRQWSDFKKYAHETLAKELLSAVDNLERAIEAAGKDKDQDDCLVSGVNITLSEILKVLERFGVTPIESKGEKFDPAYHQAVSTQESADVEDNIVLEEFQKGYMMHDRLLRPAMVVVSVKK